MSVFLTLILVPSILIACLTTDAAKIYSARTVISDAGELAMNAALAQYDEELFDRYGLLVMSKSPEEMQAGLEEIFQKSLNSTGIEGAADYAQIMSLATESFEALEINNSKIYKTDVERQQIVEYMKYRAPVCLTELLLEKINLLKNTKVLSKAATDQIEFAESMQECQDIFDETLEKLKVLDTAISSFPAEETINTDIANAGNYYKNQISICMLLYVSATEKSAPVRENGTDIGKLAYDFCNTVNAMDLSNRWLDHETTYNLCSGAKSYSEAIERIGGIDSWVGEEPDVPEKPEDETDTAAMNAYEAANEVHQEWEVRDRQRDDYWEAYNKLSVQYPEALKARITEYIREYSGKITNHHGIAFFAENDAKEAITKLNECETKLQQAESSYKTWSASVEATKGVATDDAYNEMMKEVKDFQSLFGDGTYEGRDQACLSTLRELQNIVQQDEDYFRQVRQQLEMVHMYDGYLYENSVTEQWDCFLSVARDELRNSGEMEEYKNFDSVKRRSFGNKENFYFENIETSVIKLSIADDKFYKKLQEYSEKKKNAKDDEKATNASKTGNDNLNNASSNMDSAQDVAEEKESDGKENSEHRFENYNWGDSEKWAEPGNTESGDKPYKPSAVIKKEWDDAKKAAEVGIDKDGMTKKTSNNDVNDSNKRKEVADNAKASMNASSSFLEKLSEVVAAGLEDLYIAEYTMQMFSYYTCDKKAELQSDGSKKIVTLDDKDITSITGYKLSNSPAYRAEVEYVLWGNDTSVGNVAATLGVIVGIRSLFNLIFAFTDSNIRVEAQTAASFIAGAVPFLIPILKVVYIVGVGLLETGLDTIDIKDGKGITIVKTKDTFTSGAYYSLLGNDRTKGFTFDYSEYLRVFLMIQTLVAKDYMLARIADCIQINTNKDLTKQSSMIGISADVKLNTLFMHRIAVALPKKEETADEKTARENSFNDEYTINYNSILGY